MITTPNNFLVTLLVVTSIISATIADTRVVELAPSAINSHGSGLKPPNEVFGKLPLSFEPNVGQTDARVRFLARSDGATFFLTSSEAIVSLHKYNRGSESEKLHELRSGLSQAAMRMRFVDADAAAGVVGEQRLRGKSNYFNGRNRAQWLTNIPTYSQVRVKSIYPGIDVIYHSSVDHDLEYDFYLAPKADPRVIRIKFDSVQKLTIDSEGNLELGNADLVLKAPVAFQYSASGKVNVPTRYEINDNSEVTFNVSNYDRSKPLIIDPVFRYLTYVGGAEGDQINDVAVDAEGNTYLTGSTRSLDFPTNTTIGIGQFPFFGPNDQFDTLSAFVTKLSSDGTSVIYSAYFNGDEEDEAFGIALDSTGHAYISGMTDSLSFPTTDGAFQEELKKPLGLTSPCFVDECPVDAFVAKITPDGDDIVYCTYVGGRNDDVARDIAISANGRAYITGFTQSDGSFPLKNQFQSNAVLGGIDAFVTVLNSDGTGLVYSTRLRGGANEFGNAVAVDQTGKAYVVGHTGGNNLPTRRAGGGTAFQTVNAGNIDAFVAKFDPDRSGDDSLIYSTYLGGVDVDQANAVAVNDQGVAYVAGVTRSANFPLKNALDSTHTADEAFVTIVNSNGGALQASTFLGGSGVDEALGIALDFAGGIYVTGLTTSNNFPVALPFQSSRAGGQDAFVTKLRLLGISPAIAFSSYLGGSGDDVGRGIAVLGNTDVFVGGHTESNDLQTTPATVLQATSSANVAARDGFVTRIFDTHVDTIGAFRAVATEFLLRNSNTPGPPDFTINFGQGVSLPIKGDFNGDGIDTIGTFESGAWVLRDFNVIAGYPSPGLSTSLSFGQAGDLPITGDWNGDGVDTVGVFRPATAEFFLNNENDGGTAEFIFVFGQTGDLPIAGDWDGDGIDTIGVYRPSTGQFILNNQNGDVVPDITVTFGGLAGDVPIVGDWNGDGVDTIGIFGIPRNGRPFAIGFFLSNSNTVPSNDLVFGFGTPGDQPLAGDWDGKP